MKKYWFFLLGFVLLFSQTGLLTAQAQSQSISKLSPQLQTAITGQPQGSLRVIVQLRHTPLPAIRASAQRAERLSTVVGELQRSAQLSQEPAVRILEHGRLAGQVEEYTSLWIINGIAVTAEPAVLEKLAALPEVIAIVPDAQIPAPDPVIGTTAGSPSLNLQIIRVPQLWAQGVTGKGVVVANLDTGVNANHPDLSSRWRGGSNSWFDPYGEQLTPADLNGHGTWTMGVMVGGDSSGTALGIAPGATWIAARIFNNQGTANISAIHRAFQWILDPDRNPATDDAPHVVNNSWGYTEPSCVLEFQPDLLALRAAGILPIFAAGNEGPSSYTSTSPANNPAAFSVGATNPLNDQIYSLSSRGTTNCGQPVTVFPDITAPGVGIRSAGLNGGYFTADGTSLAAPHAAGTLALLLSVRPSLSVAEQESILSRAVVDLGPLGSDNMFGAGRLDAWSAYTMLSPEPFQPPNKIFMPSVY